MAQLTQEKNTLSEEASVFCGSWYFQLLGSFQVDSCFSWLSLGRGLRVLLFSSRRLRRRVSELGSEFVAGEKQCPRRLCQGALFRALVFCFKTVCRQLRVVVFLAKGLYTFATLRSL